MSKYFQSLSLVHSNDYETKLESLGLKTAEDPFIVLEAKHIDSSTWIDDVQKWPNLELPAIMSYLVLTKGPFTLESVQAYRSLEAYNFYSSGWVRTVYYRAVKKGVCVLAGKVTRSQAVTDVPHNAWIGVKTCKGQAVVETAHCSCMAGLGEVCSHVAAIMFKVERAGHLGYSNQSCTEVPCQWNQNYTKNVVAVPLSDVVFDKPSRNEEPIQPQASTPDPVPDDPTALLQELRTTTPDAAVFTVLSPKKNKPIESQLPRNLTTLFQEKNRSLTEEELNDLCLKTVSELFPSHTQCDNLELKTRKQSKSLLWHTYRLGRITASVMQDVVNCKNGEPSEALIRSVCYRNDVSTPAIRWGRDLEETALKSYKQMISIGHDNITVNKSGFVINPDYPAIGASPDAIVNCDCCGKGVIEIKCPYKFKDVHPCSIDDTLFCLARHDSHSCSGALRPKHKYFCQIQTQMGVCRANYCDFVCYTQKGIHVERILFDNKYFTSHFHKAKHIFSQFILKELLTNSLQKEKSKKRKRD